ncbi:MAG: hypothetical protein RL220_20 [Bacteroidota bacterium]|jgi:phosphate transport system substrate-binding protein
MKLLNALLVAVFAVMISSCGNYDLHEETVQSGTLRIGIDESYTLMMDSQVFVFEQLYKYADIVPSYLPEGEVIDLLLKDSIRAAVICRPLNEQELALFESKKRFPESVAIAQDGLAFIVNPASTDSVFTVEQLEKIFRGEITTWDELGRGGPKEKIEVVFDNNNSCNFRQIKERFVGDVAFPSNCYAVKGNEQVMDHVATHPGSVGVISVSWISDTHDPTSLSFINKVKVCGVVDPANLKRPDLPRKPIPAYIYDKSYPFGRTVYAIRAGTKGSLGTGFVSHLAGEKGQLIIQKMGMVPTTLHVRTVKVTEE